MDTDSFIVYIKTDDIHKDIGKAVESRLVYELDRSLPKETNKKVIGLMKDELGEKIMTKFVGLRTKTYSYLIYDSSEDKKVRGTKKGAIKRKLKFENYKNYLEATQLDNEIKYLEKIKTQQKFKSERHNVFTEEINKIALSSNDDKKMQSIDSIETYAI